MQVVMICDDCAVCALNTTACFRQSLLPYMLRAHSIPSSCLLQPFAVTTPRGSFQFTFPLRSLFPALPCRRSVHLPPFIPPSSPNLVVPSPALQYKAPSIFMYVTLDNWRFTVDGLHNDIASDRLGGARAFPSDRNLLHTHSTITVSYGVLITSMPRIRTVFHILTNQCGNVWNTKSGISTIVPRCYVSSPQCIESCHQVCSRRQVSPDDAPLSPSQCDIITRNALLNRRPRRLHIYPCIASHPSILHVLSPQTTHPPTTTHTPTRRRK